MKKIQSSALMMAIAIAGTTAFTACSSSDDVGGGPVFTDDNGNVGVKSEFVLSIPRTVVGTRMTNDMTQSAGTATSFRGIDNIRLIPFSTEPTRSTAKIADILSLGAVNALSSPGSLNYKIYADQFVPVGTKNFLFYGKAIDNEEEVAITSMDDKFHFGFLNAQGLEEDEFESPNSIMFSLEQINTSEAEQANDETGKRIVALLNSLAKTSVTGVDAPHNKWSTTTNLALATLYKRFLCISTYSSNNLAALLGKLYFSMDFVPNTDPARPLVNEIKRTIEGACASTPAVGEPVSLKSDYAGYPANIGLPDGAVRVRWNAANAGFKDVSVRFTKDFNLKLTDYVYPAALWYYTNTPLKAAFDKKSDKYEGATKWSEVISGVYSNAPEEVKAGTQSIALQNQAEYGVGRIETKVKMGEDPVFRDARGKEVNVGNGYKLTGILLGGQRNVDYSFHPINGSAEMTIYDREMAGDNIIAKKSYTTPANQTLALETVSNQVVYAAIELVNGGDEFVGADGVIPAGGTFYMTVRLDPRDAENYQSGTLDKIVQQDYVTKLTVTIKNGATTVDRNSDGIPDEYLKDEDDNIIGVDADGDGVPDDTYDIDGDGDFDDVFVPDPEHGGPGWDTDGDGEVDIPIVPDADGNYPDTPPIPEGLGNATNGVPDLTSPGIELGTSVNLEWKEGLVLNPEI